MTYFCQGKSVVRQNNKSSQKHVRHMPTTFRPASTTLQLQNRTCLKLFDKTLVPPHSTKMCSKSTAFEIFFSICLFA